MGKKESAVPVQLVQGDKHAKQPNCFKLVDKAKTTTTKSVRLQVEPETN